MAFFAQDDAVDLQGEIAALRKQVASLARSMSKRGASAYRDTRDEAYGLYDGIAEHIGSALPVVRRRARDLEETIRDNPTRTLAVVGLAALAVAAAVMLTSRR